MDILVSEELRNPALALLEQKYRVVHEPNLWREPDRLLALIAESRALLLRNQTQVTAEVLRAGHQLLALGRVGVGLDNIDVAEASRRGVVVVAPLNANATSVAELTLGLLLALARKLPQADASTKAGAWDRKGSTGMEVAGKTLAICGLGRIGALVAARARAFGLTVVAYDPFVKPGAPVLQETGAALCSSLKEAVQQSHFVTVHLPLTPDTRNLFNASVFAEFRPGSYFINTSRGGVVDETALTDALRSGTLAGAALDVRSTEPPPPKGPLESLPNVILTPHVGALTAEAQARTFQAVALDIHRLLSGEPALNAVNFDRPRK